MKSSCYFYLNNKCLTSCRYNQTRYPNTKQDYQTLFINTMKTEFDKITFGKGIFITSTPSNGDSDAKIAQNPNNPFYGDGK